MGFCHYLRFSILFFLLIFNTEGSYAQIRPGIKFGVSTPDVDPKDFIVTDNQGVELYQVFVEKARYGVHAGAFIQMQLGHFFMQPEILYNSTSIDYRIDSLFSGFGVNKFRDTYQNIDFPLVLGMKAGPLRIGGGPVAHISLKGRGGFNEYEDFEDFFEELTWGWQAGVGLDFWKLHIDVRYEGNLTQLGDHITFFDRRFDFDTNNNRFIASLGFSF